MLVLFWQGDKDAQDISRWAPWNEERRIMTSASKTEPAEKAAVAGKVVLVMQGGGAQAAYEGGVYEALHEAGIEPDWVIGTSIGAINGSIIAGNELKSRLKRLREFWSRIESRPTWPSGPMFGNAANQLTTLLTGVPGFFSPNTAFLWGPEAAVGVEHAALYSVDPLRKLLPELVDFDLANSGKPRFTLGLVGVRSGRIRYFDSRDEKIGLDHVLGSSAVPPTFPAVRIDGEALGRGHLLKHTGRGRIRRLSAAELRRLRGTDLAHARRGTRICRPGLCPPEGHYVWQPVHEPYRGAGQAPPHAARRSHAGQHAPRGEAKYPRGPGARRLRLRNHHASARDQCRAARRREQFSRIRLLPGHHRCALAGRIRGYVPSDRAAAVGQSD